MKNERNAKPPPDQQKIPPYRPQEFQAPGTLVTVQDTYGPIDRETDQPQLTSLHIQLHAASKSVYPMSLS